MCSPLAGEVARSAGGDAVLAITRGCGDHDRVDAWIASHTLIG
jgi:hypothetical protein